MGRSLASTTSGSKWCISHQSGSTLGATRCFEAGFEHTLDAKGRLALPAAFKRTLAQTEEDTLVITTHISSPCLVAYTVSEWAAFEAKLSALPQFEPSVMLMRRLYVGSAMDCPIDKLGRLLVPPMLREHAKIEREVYWVGAIKTMEIWSRAVWQAEVEEKRPEVGPDLLAKLGDLGL